MTVIPWGCVSAVEDLEHALKLCQSYNYVGLQLLQFLRGFMSALQTESLLRLEFHVEPDLELPAVLFISTVLSSVWKLRQSNSRVQKYLVRSQMEAKINLLRETRYSNAAILLDQLVVDFCGTPPNITKRTVLRGRFS